MRKELRLVIASLFASFGDEAELFADQVEDFALGPAGEDELSESSAEGRKKFGAAARGGGAGGDHGAESVADREQAICLEFAVGGGDGVEVHAEVGGELADGREGSAFDELAAGDEFAEAVGDLLVDGAGVVGVDGEEHFCMVYGYSIH
jgi:hypothetical protein